MRFQLREESRTAQGRSAAVVVLEDTHGPARAEVWPGLGFNCYHWEVGLDAGRVADVLYVTDEFWANPVPTRSGIPVLFPFPNRIRDGRFTWDGRAYQLPCNDHTARNAIHGFACRAAWRVIDRGADEQSAWVTGEFQLSRDAADAVELWPADARLRLTCRLGERRLRLEAVVDNPDRQALPFGLGYHPYFRLPLIKGAPADECQVAAAASAVWELQETLPTGRQWPVDAARDLRRPRRCAELTLDDVFTGLPAGSEMVECGRLVQPSAGAALAVRAAADFRELVVFTPPHRQAICLEPYTCVTDAVNLQQRGVEAGWRVLAPGASWAGVVELTVG